MVPSRFHLWLHPSQRIWRNRLALVFPKHRKALRLLLSSPWQPMWFLEHLNQLRFDHRSDQLLSRSTQDSQVRQFRDSPWLRLPLGPPREIHRRGFLRIVQSLCQRRRRQLPESLFCCHRDQKLHLDQPGESIPLPHQSRFELLQEVIRNQFRTQLHPG